MVSIKSIGGDDENIIIIIILLLYYFLFRTMELLTLLVQMYM